MDCQEGCQSRNPTDLSKLLHYCKDSGQEWSIDKRQIVDGLSQLWTDFESSFDLYFVFDALYVHPVV